MRVCVRKIISRLASLLFILAITLVLAEIVLRVFVYLVEQEGATGEGKYLQPIPYSIRSYGMKPMLPPPMSTNSQGFRGKEFSEAKDAGTYRIVMLGDSITFGNGVDADETFSAVLQEKLNAATTSYSYEVYNLGVSGYNTLQELATLREVGLKYKPDAILLNVCINDSDATKELTPLGIKNRDEIQGVNDINIRTIVGASYALTFLRSKAIRLFKQFGIDISEWNSPVMFINSRVDESAWTAMKEDMKEILNLAMQNGVPVGVVILPYRAQVDRPEIELRPQQDLRAFFQGLGVPVLDPIDIYRTAEHDMFVDGYLHLSSYGHARIAEAIIERFRTAGLIPP